MTTYDVRWHSSGTGADEALVATLDDVNAALDTETLKELMVRVEVDAEATDVVAADWLAEQG